MDLSTVIGIIAAFALVILAIMTGGGIILFINIPSFIIVVGGTIGATLVHYPFKDVFRAAKVFQKTVFHKEQTAKDTISLLIGFADKARKEGILALESAMEQVDDPFIKKSLQMAVDGQESEDLSELLNREIDYVQERHESGAEIFVAMGTYAPALGMIGTLIGLVQMLQTMNDPSTIGPAMAVALLTTFYGAIIANIICMPVAGKLRLRSQEEVLHKTLIADGIRCILGGENPRVMEQRLHTFIPPKHRESNFGRKD